MFQEQTSSLPGDKSTKVSESILRLFPGFDAFILPPATVDSEMMKGGERSGESFILERFREF